MHLPTKTITLEASVGEPTLLVEEGRLHIMIGAYFKKLYKQLKGIGPLVIVHQNISLIMFRVS